MKFKRLVNLVLIAGLMVFLTAEVGLSLEPIPAMSDADFAEAKYQYFDRCSGCHGALRQGATGPNITPAKTLKKSLAKLEKVLFVGTEGGMPGLGKDGFMTKAEVKRMAKYIQMRPPQPPEWGIDEIMESWKVHVPVTDRPSKKPKGIKWKNYFGVIQRDIGEVAIVNGDTKKIVANLYVGYSVHILKISATGRYMYAITRDAKAALIDLWMDPPQIVAEVKAGIDARSIAASQYKGEKGDFRDKYVAVGDYWPAQYVVMSGDTLEPLKVISTSGKHIDYSGAPYITNARVASIAASYRAPEWLVNIKERGVVVLADYSVLDAGVIDETEIAAERFLHDGGWDSTKRYFLVAANARDTISVIDTVDRKHVANIVTGTKPHPGRGANWKDPEYGRVWATVHLGEGLVSIISTDPKRSYAWSVVREWKLDGNSLFIKTHPKSQHVYCDNTINKNKSRVLTIFDKKNPTAPPKELVFNKVVVHMEFNKKGNEVWVSLWDKNGEIVVIDDKTLSIKKRIPGFVNPTGKFNVYNTMKAIY